MQIRIFLIMVLLDVLKYGNSLYVRAGIIPEAEKECQSNAADGRLDALDCVAYNLAPLGIRIEAIDGAKGPD
jgi:hypothetical protein